MKMGWSELFKKIAEGDVAKVYLFAGEEHYIKRQAIDTLKKSLLPEGLEALNETALEGVNAQQIIEACETMPFMCDRRLVTVRDWAPLMPGKSRDEEQNAERISQWLPNTPDGCCLVFWMESGMDARKKSAVALKSQGVFVDFELLGDDKLGSWLKARAQKEDASIEPKAIERLVFLAGHALTRLDGEVSKLSAYAGQGGTITRDMVDALVPPSPESTVFQMIDMLMDGKIGRAMELTQTLLRSGENRIGILAMITRQMRLLTHMKLLKSKGMSLTQIEKQLALNHYGAMRMERQLSRFNVEQLQAAYRSCIEADFQIKSGKAHDDAALDKLLLELSAMRS